MTKLRTFFAAFALAAVALAPLGASAQTWGDTMIEGNTDGIESDSSGGYATGEDSTSASTDVEDAGNCCTEVR